MRVIYLRLARCCAGGHTAHIIYRAFVLAPENPRLRLCYTYAYIIIRVRGAGYNANLISFGMS